MDKALEKLKDEIENQTSSKIIKQIKVTPIFYEYMIKSVGIYGTFGKDVEISFFGRPIIVDNKLEKHFEIEYVENKDLDWTSLILLAILLNMNNSKINIKEKNNEKQYRYKKTGEVYNGQIYVNGECCTDGHGNEIIYT